MGKGLADKKIVLIAVADKEQKERITTLVSEHVSKCQFYYASDGSETLSKIDNDPPDILIVDEHLSRFSGIQITEKILEKKNSQIGVIILSQIPEQDRFVDEVVIGQIQFASNFQENASKILNRVLNYISYGDKAEFRLCYLSPKELLMREGDKAEFVYILKKGSLQAVVKRQDKNILLGNIEPGEFVGEMSYINGEMRNASIIALSDCELIEIPIDQMDHLLFQKPAWARALLKTLSKRVKVNNEKLAVTVS
ncbi:MAG: cyclic nucleotide-binding domain-containing protein [Bdellovibrionales bacterium]